ncbi:MAG TPA: P-II family nitrogen regulator [Pirellulales bacterium]|nr:P-II family nitrogen regulator [Pirellulales bacterium]
MYKVEALIGIERLGRLEDDLKAQGIGQFAVFGVRDQTARSEQPLCDRGVRSTANFVQRLKIELQVPAHLLDVALDCMVAAASTDRGNDDRLAVTEIVDSLEINRNDAAARAVATGGTVL